jgi:protein-glutamine gamma-glutamyltransferase
VETSSIDKDLDQIRLFTERRFEDYFRFTSYMMIACGVLSLVVSGGVSIGLAGLVGIGFFIAWKVEASEWKLSERVGLIIVALLLPLFYIDWKYQINTDAGIDHTHAAITALIHLVLLLSFVKLLQPKTDRGWLLLYLISFFEILLAAGFSISPKFLVALCLYLFFALATIISFEIRKSKRSIANVWTRRVAETDEEQRSLFLFLKRGKNQYKQQGIVGIKHLSGVAICLLLLILILALPIFLVTPRFSGNILSRMGGPTGLIGFSDSINLGQQGRLSASENIVMRVRVETPSGVPRRYIRWRGVALDHFNGKDWSRTNRASKYIFPRETGLFPLTSLKSLDQVGRLTTQTFYLEPIGKSVLFAAPHTIALQGEFSKILSDVDDNISTSHVFSNRISYRVYSDTEIPERDKLKSDEPTYPLTETKYLQLPDRLDGRIKTLTEEIIKEKAASNRYDKAAAIESWLSRNLKYSLDRKASGEDPLADFLFNVREGHCEYFSTAMAIMLRTQNIDARVVNGFQMGEYNDAADIFTVREKDAHSWVEVYSPSTMSWISFDPTPVSGQQDVNRSSGLSGTFNKYIEALEMLWIQYVVAYDKQEQQQLASSVKNRINQYSGTVFHGADNLVTTLTGWWDSIKSQLRALSTHPGSFSSWFKLILLLLPLLSLILSFSLIKRLYYWYTAQSLRKLNKNHLIVEFYERMIKSLAARGLRRTEDQTPLEFALTTGIPEAMFITKAYNQVRYGSIALSSVEMNQIESYLKNLEKVRR